MCSVSDCGQCQRVSLVAAETKLTCECEMSEDMKTLHAITALKVDSVSNILISGTSLGYLQVMRGMS